MWLVRNLVEVEAFFTSVERLVHYSKRLPLEADYIIEGNSLPLGFPPLMSRLLIIRSRLVHIGNRPPSNWPERGEVEFDNVTVKYAEDAPPVLSNISFKTCPAEKIGIVGRTGAGKSTLFLALFRILEAMEGKILIDDIDIRTIGLYDLRSKLGIIPQDPILFTGTIRTNLDPFKAHSDSEIWDALEKVDLFGFITPSSM